MSDYIELSMGGEHQPDAGHVLDNTNETAPTGAEWLGARYPQQEHHVEITDPWAVAMIAGALATVACAMTLKNRLDRRSNRQD